MIDDDGDIKFKRQGDTCFISISPKDENPMIVMLSKYFNYNDDITRTKLLLYNDGDNSYKMCKIIPANEYYILRTEIFFTAASSFTNIFYRVLQVMDDVEEAIREL